VASGLRGLLYGVAPHDPPTLAAVVVLVASASLAAAWVPARRAARVEPWELLRDE
jgi:ABC-type lipoprotein release transport system permease subunit